MKKTHFPLVILITLACTIGIYYLIWGEQTSTLFYINMIITCITEVILLANIPIWSGEKIMTVKNIAISTLINRYAILVFLWTVIFSLIIYNPGSENYKVLVLGLLFITLLFAVIGGATMVGGNATEEYVEDLESKSNNKKTVVFSVQDSFDNIKEALCGIDSEWKDETIQTLRIIVDKIGAMPIEQLSKNLDVASELKERMDGILELSESLSTAENKEEVQARITRKTNQLKNYLATVKTIM